MNSYCGSVESMKPSALLFKVSLLLRALVVVFGLKCGGDFSCGRGWGIHSDLVCFMETSRL